MQNIKKYCGLLLLCWFSFISFAWADFSGGDGTENNPYQIGSSADLVDLANKVKNDNNNYASKYYVLIKNIDMQNIETIPIGGIFINIESINPRYAFKGSFNGQGYTIRNLTMNGDPDTRQLTMGLFGYTLNADIKNVRLENISITGTKGLPPRNDNKTFVYVGGLIGYAANTKVRTCEVSGTVRTDNNHIAMWIYIGGVVGIMTNDAYEKKPVEITHCTNHATIDVQLNPEEIYTVFAGGIAGHASGKQGVFSYNKNTGNVLSPVTRENFATFRIWGRTSGPSYLAGGLFGELIGSGFGEPLRAFHNNVNTGNIAGFTAGGIVGQADGLLSMSQLANFGDITGFFKAGGLVATTGSIAIEIQKSISKGNILVTGASMGLWDLYGGGLVGYASSPNIKIQDCLVDASLELLDTYHYYYYGGVVGRIRSSPNNIIKNVLVNVELRNISNGTANKGLIGGEVGKETVLSGVYINKDIAEDISIFLYHERGGVGDTVLLDQPNLSKVYKLTTEELKAASNFNQNTDDPWNVGQPGSIWGYISNNPNFPILKNSIPLVIQASGITKPYDTNTNSNVSSTQLSLAHVAGDALPNVTMSGTPSGSYFSPSITDANMIALSNLGLAGADKDFYFYPDDPPIVYGEITNASSAVAKVTTDAKNDPDSILPAPTVTLSGPGCPGVLSAGENANIPADVTCAIQISNPPEGYERDGELSIQVDGSDATQIALASNGNYTITVVQKLKPIATAATITVANRFNPTNSGGTLPHLSFAGENCPTFASGTITITEGVVCQIVASGAVAPDLYELGATVIKVNNSVVSDNKITLTNGATYAISIETQLTAKPTATFSIIGQYSIPGVSGGLPLLNLAGCPVSGYGMHTNQVITENVTCTVNVASPAAPAGYDLLEPPYTIEVKEDGNTLPSSIFTLHNNKTYQITVTVNIQASPRRVQFTVINRFDPDNVGGTPPSLNITTGCPLLTDGEHTIPDSPTTCEITAAGGTAPDGYTLGEPVISINGEATSSLVLLDGAEYEIVVKTPLIAASKIELNVSSIFEHNGAEISDATSEPTKIKFSGSGCPIGSTYSAGLYSQVAITSGANCTLEAVSDSATLPNDYEADGVVTIDPLTLLNLQHDETHTIKVVTPIKPIATKVTIQVNHQFTPVSVGALSGASAPKISLSGAGCPTDALHLGENELTTAVGMNCHVVVSAPDTLPDGYTYSSATINGHSSETLALVNNETYTLNIVSSYTQNTYSAEFELDRSFSPTEVGGTLPATSLTGNADCAALGTNPSGIKTIVPGTSCSVFVGGAVLPEGYDTQGVSTVTVMKDGVLVSQPFTLEADKKYKIIVVTPISNSAPQTATGNLSVEFRNSSNMLVSGGAAPTISLSGDGCSGVLNSGANTLPAGKTCTIDVADDYTLPSGYYWTATNTSVDNAPTSSINVTADAAYAITVVIQIDLTPTTKVVIEREFHHGTTAISGGTLPMVALVAGDASCPGNVGNEISLAQNISCTIQLDDTLMGAPTGYALIGNRQILVDGSTSVTLATGTATEKKIRVIIPVGKISQVTAASEFSVDGTSGGTEPTITLSCSPAATEISAYNWSVVEGANCSFQVDKSAAQTPIDYQFTTTPPQTDVVVTGVNPSASSFIMPISMVSIQATTKITPLPKVQIRNRFINSSNVEVSGGTLPKITLTGSGCPGEIAAGTTSLRLAIGVSCTVSVDYSAVATPTGYQADPAWNSNNPMLLVDGAAGSTISITEANHAIQLDAKVKPDETTVTASNLFIDTVGGEQSGGTLPKITLSCTPAATVLEAGKSWNVSTGASCKVDLSYDSAAAPTGYAFSSTPPTSVVTVAQGTITNRVFTKMANQDPQLKVATAVEKALQPAKIVRNVFSDGTQEIALIGTMTLPKVEVRCGTSNTVVGLYPDFKGYTGESCKMVVKTAATTIDRYPFVKYVYGGTGVNATTGAFTMPAGGVSDLSITTQVAVQMQTVTLKFGLSGLAAGVQAMQDHPWKVMLTCGGDVYVAYDMLNKSPYNEASLANIPNGRSCTLAAEAQSNYVGTDGSDGYSYQHYYVRNFVIGQLGADGRPPYGDPIMVNIVVKKTESVPSLSFAGLFALATLLLGLQHARRRRSC